MLTLLANLFDPIRLIGPIFDKELRVASRRRRTYAVRFFYIIALIIIISIALLTANFAMRTAPPGPTGTPTNAALSISQLSEMARVLTQVIIWFQFFVLQVAAINGLATAINEEIRRRTLGVLLSTPISSFQIVLGKLFSGLLRVFILLALSLPILALIRVYGGIPAGFVTAGLSVTACAIIFAGSISLAASITAQNNQKAMSFTIGILALLYFFLPAILTFVAFQYGQPPLLISLIAALQYINPYSTLATLTAQLNFAALSLPPVNWTGHCLTILALSTAVLIYAMFRVRKAALRQAVGGTAKKRKSFKLPFQRADEICRVKGHPIAWKDTRSIPGQKRTIVHYITLGIFVLLIIAAYIICAFFQYFQNPGCQMTFILSYILLASIQTLNFAATSIVAEREARTWPIILTLPLSEQQILSGKAQGVFLRCRPLWALLIVHTLFFTIIGFIHPLVIFYLAAIIPTLYYLFTSIGMFASACAKRVSSAINIAFGIILLIWLVLPTLVTLVGLYYVWFLNPLAQIVMLIGETMNTYSRTGRIGFSIVAGVFVVAITVAIHLGIAKLFRYWTTKYLYRNLFNES